jgi:hypothetical protein
MRRSVPSISASVGWTWILVMICGGRWRSTAIGKPLQRFLPLVRCRLARPTKLDATSLGALAALAHAGADQLALELANPPRTVR